MKIHSIWSLAVACVLCGCASRQPVIAYNHPLTSPGGEFSKLPPVVQNSVRAEAGSAQIESISKEARGDSPIYVFHFTNHDVFPPLYVASDGSVLSSNLTVAVGASEGAIEASTASEAGGLRLDDLPPNVVETIRHSAPTAEVNSISRFTSERDVFYDVTFKDSAHHPNLLIRDDGKLMQ